MEKVNLSAKDIIELSLESSNKVKELLEFYELSINEVSVFLFNEDNFTLQRIDKNQKDTPIALWYNITKNDIHSINIDTTHEVFTNKHLQLLSKAS